MYIQTITNLRFIIGIIIIISKPVKGTILDYIVVKLRLLVLCWSMINIKKTIIYW